MRIARVRMLFEIFGERERRAILRWKFASVSMQMKFLLRAFSLFSKAKINCRSTNCKRLNPKIDSPLCSFPIIRCMLIGNVEYNVNRVSQNRAIATRCCKIHNNIQITLMIIAKHIAIDTGMTYRIDASMTLIMLITLYFITHYCTWNTVRNSDWYNIIRIIPKYTYRIGYRNWVLINNILYTLVTTI